jgi:hypothetical protein
VSVLDPRARVLARARARTRPDVLVALRAVGLLRAPTRLLREEAVPHHAAAPLLQGDGRLLRAPTSLLRGAKALLHAPTSLLRGAKALLHARAQLPGGVDALPCGRAPLLRGAEAFLHAHTQRLRGAEALLHPPARLLGGAHGPPPAPAPLLRGARTLLHARKPLLQEADAWPRREEPLLPRREPRGRPLPKKRSRATARLLSLLRKSDGDVTERRSIRPSSCPRI